MDKAQLKMKLILASGSPRRQQFFRDMNLEFEIRIREIEEIYPAHLQAHEITNFLAELKAAAFKDLKDDELLVTSDTIVWHLGFALGKPKDYYDAFRILRRLADSTHEVITSVCITTNKGFEVFHEVTRVTFGALSDEMISYYLETFKPFDKAGAYGIQEWIGLVGIKKIEGSYSNVVGMPTQKLYESLKKFAIL